MRSGDQVGRVALENQEITMSMETNGVTRSIASETDHWPKVSIKWDT